MDSKNIIIIVLAVLVLVSGTYIATNTDLFKQETTADDVKDKVGEAGKAIGDYVGDQADKLTK